MDLGSCLTDMDGMPVLEDRLVEKEHVTRQSGGEMAATCGTPYATGPSHGPVMDFSTVIMGN